MRIRALNMNYACADIKVTVMIITMEAPHGSSRCSALVRMVPRQTRLDQISAIVRLRVLGIHAIAKETS